MWFDGIRQPDTLYVANTSRGKDSTAMLRAIQLMGWPLDMIVSVDIWATQDIPAELPPMVAFKDEYDRKVLEWFGVPVTRLCATKRERERELRPSVLLRHVLPGTWNGEIRRNYQGVPSHKRLLVQTSQVSRS